MPLDFSANVSPLGLPEGVRRAAAAALEQADRYPDPLCRDLCAAIGRAESVGSLEPGKRGDLLIWEARDLNYVCYRMGSNLVHTVVKGGKTYSNTTGAN